MIAVLPREKLPGLPDTGIIHPKIPTISYMLEDIVKDNTTEGDGFKNVEMKTHVSSEYLKLVLSFMTISDNVAIKVKNSYPIVVETKYVHGYNEIVHEEGKEDHKVFKTRDIKISFMLAPRIESS